MKTLVYIKSNRLDRSSIDNLGSQMIEVSAAAKTKFSNLFFVGGEDTLSYE